MVFDFSTSLSYSLSFDRVNRHETSRFLISLEICFDPNHSVVNGYLYLDKTGEITIVFPPSDGLSLGIFEKSVVEEIKRSVCREQLDHLILVSESQREERKRAKEQN